MALIEIVIGLIAMVVLARQIAFDSTLAYDVKKLTSLDKPKSWIKASSKWGFFNKLLPKPLLIAFSPIIIIIIILSNVWIQVINLFNCHYCLSMHLGFWYTYLFMDQNIIGAITWGLITVALTEIYEKFING